MSNSTSFAGPAIRQPSTRRSLGLSQRLALLSAATFSAVAWFGATRAPLAPAAPRVATLVAAEDASPDDVLVFRAALAARGFDVRTVRAPAEGLAAALAAAVAPGERQVLLGLGRDAGRAVAAQPAAGLVARAAVMPDCADAPAGPPVFLAVDLRTVPCAPLPPGSEVLRLARSPLDRVASGDPGVGSFSRRADAMIRERAADAAAAWLRARVREKEAD